MVTAVGLCRRDIVMACRALEHPTVGWIGAGRMGLQMASRLRTEDFVTLILEQSRRSDITLAAENVKVDDGLEASS
jgi:lactate dehydrogenase-like 2-hydroxyacid dehydrogenase